MNELVLSLVALVSSMVTAVSGVGGGMILIAFMPGLVPAPAIVPVHGMVQLFSNSSRALFGWRFVRWELMLAFAGGLLAGGLVAAGITASINLEYVPVMIGGWILWSVWGPRLQRARPLRGEFVFFGILQIVLGMMVGATGPLGQAAMLRRGLGRDALVVTSALMMTLTHLVKVILFALLGFAFIDYWRIIAGMSVGVVVGALIGTRLRYRVPERIFGQALKWLLTALALRMIYQTLA